MFDLLPAMITVLDVSSVPLQYSDSEGLVLCRAVSNGLEQVAKGLVVERDLMRERGVMVTLGRGSTHLTLTPDP